MWWQMLRYSRVIDDLKSIAFLEGEIICCPSFIIIQGHKERYTTCKKIKVDDMHKGYTKTTPHKQHNNG